MFRRSLYLLASALFLGAPVVQADAGRLWVWNLGDQPAEIAAESSGAGVSVEAGEAVEVPALRKAADQLVSPGAEVLVVEASQDFDPSALEVDGRGEIRRETKGRAVQIRVIRPDWARELLALAVNGPRLAAGETVEVPAVAGQDGRVRLAVGLERDSALRVALQDEQGQEIRSFTASSTAPVRWRADLGSAAELADVRLVLRVDRGSAVTSVPVVRKGGMQSATAAAIVGTASFSQSINGSASSASSLYFYVTNGPPNTCGELSTYRNGSWLFGANYLCTDASGNATKGPWTWANTPSNQTDDPLYIRWPNGDTTNNVWHIWDKNAAVTYRDSAWGMPPTTFSGHATDAQWGTGFDFGGNCFADFVDQTPNPDLWWSSSTGTYSSTSYKSVTYTTSRVNRWYVNWSGPFPSAGSHVSGHTYRWTACCTDGSSGQCTGSSFTVP